MSADQTKRLNRLQARIERINMLIERDKRDKPKVAALKSELEVREAEANFLKKKISA